MISARRWRQRTTRTIIRLYDVPPEMFGDSRWAGGVWWRLRRDLRRWL